MGAQQKKRSEQRKKESPGGRTSNTAAPCLASGACDRIIWPLTALASLPLQFCNCNTHRFLSWISSTLCLLFCFHCLHYYIGFTFPVHVWPLNTPLWEIWLCHIFPSLRKFLEPRWQSPWSPLSCIFYVSKISTIQMINKHSSVR